MIVGLPRLHGTSEDVAGAAPTGTAAAAPGQPPASGPEAGTRTSARQSGVGDTEIERPTTLLRIATTVQGALQEMRDVPLDRAARRRLARSHDRTLDAVGRLLPAELRDELRTLVVPVSDEVHPPSAAELRIAHAQLAGWLEGLLSGIQATIVSEHLARMRDGDEARRTRIPDTSVAASPYL